MPTRVKMNDPESHNSDNHNSDPTHDIENGFMKPGLVCSHSSKKWDKMEVDMTRVQNAIDETGNNSYGIIAVYVWYLNEEDGTLYHFDKGINWVSPIYREQLEQDIKMKHILYTLKQIDEQTAEAEISGVGLAGNFWQLYGDSAGRNGGDWSQPLLWRDLREFTTDPDQMPSARLISLAKVFGKCTGIPFSIQGKFKGVVLYFVRDKCDVTAITSDVNTNFLHFSSQYIGAASAMKEARTKAVAKRKEILTKTCKKFMLTLRTANAFKSLLEVSKVSIEIERPLNPRRKQPLLVDNFRKCIHAVNYICQSALSKAKSLYKKSVEPPLSPPPGASVATSIWISIGCFMTLLLLFGLNIFVKDVSNDEYIIVLGPLGALLTLQFALTAAPAAQPRNSVYGFMVSILISLFCKFLLFEVLHIPQWLAAAIGVSLAIGCMSKAGVVHPPGGAAALIFTMSKHSIDKDLKSGMTIMPNIARTFSYRTMTLCTTHPLWLRVAIDDS
eukprot:scaffold991_cov279-Chaetoceros_neogracile.AAC.31